MSWQQNFDGVLARRGSGETRQRILEAAIELFAAQGVATTTVKAIGQRAGVTDAALYYYFHSKHEIFESLWRIYTSAAPPSVVQAPPGVSLPALLEIVEAQYVQWLGQEPLIRLMLREGLSGNAAAREYFNLCQQGFCGSLEEALADAVGERAAVVTEAICAVLTGVTLNGLLCDVQPFSAFAQAPGFRPRLRAMLAAALEARLPAAG